MEAAVFRGFTSIVYKESIHILRDPRTLFLMILIPGIQLTIFGYAIDMDVKHVKTVVYGLDTSDESRRIVDAFVNTGYFDITRYVHSDDELIDAIVAGDAKIAIKFPPDFSDHRLRGTRASFQVLIDGSDSTVAMQALNVSNAIALEQSLEVVAGQLDTQNMPPVEVRPRMLFNPDMKTANFMVPGLVAIVMQVVTMFLTAFAIVKEKENGTLEQLMVTPVSRLGLVLGKLMPYGVVGTIETITVILIMRFIFDVPIAGSLLLLAAFSLIFLFCALGLGLLISSLANNQVQAIQFAFVVMLPSVLLSGFIFPQESMPFPIYVLGQAIPATFFVRILRGIILREAGFTHLWPQAAALAVMGVLLVAISTKNLRKTLG